MSALTPLAALKAVLEYAKTDLPGDNCDAIHKIVWPTLEEYEVDDEAELHALVAKYNDLAGSYGKILENGLAVLRDSSADPASRALAGTMIGAIEMWRFTGVATEAILEGDVPAAGS